MRHPNCRSWTAPYFPRRCRVCGCTDDEPCLMPTAVVVGLGNPHAVDVLNLVGPRNAVVCTWILEDLCSGCAVRPVAILPGDLDRLIGGAR